jgi:hypothetical protein
LEERRTVSSCSVDSLTLDGQSLLDLSRNETAWERTKAAYAGEEYYWSVPDFHGFLKNQGSRRT